MVRAENDETCDSGPANGGVTDDNTVYGAGTNATSQAPPGEVGATLYVDPVNRAHVRLSWSATAGATTYRVYRADHAGAAFQLVGETTALVYEDAGVFGDGLDAAETLVRDVMSKAPDYVDEDLGIEMALANMRAGPYRRLPVVDKQRKLVGIISLDDILDLLAEEFAEIGRLVRKESPESLASS